VSRKKSLVEERPVYARATADQDQRAQAEPDSSDFWGNLVYFLILTTAIGFVLANNTSSLLLTHTGVVVLALLLFLDLFPIVHLVRRIVCHPMIHGSR
jgi:hypothetical protein